MSNTEEPKFQQVAEGARDLSLGISMVVAVVIGVAIGLGLRSLTGISWTLWIGVFIGVGASILNVYKAYEKQKASLDELAKDPRYTYKAEQEAKRQKKYDDEDEDDKY
ncbi:MAG: AtpZ/AtpI family protein [Sulfurovum sp.]